MSDVCTNTISSQAVTIEPKIAASELLDNAFAPDVRLIPCAIDEYARSQPHGLFASIPISSSVLDGFRDVTFTDFSNAVNQAAAWLETSECQTEPLAYLAPSDLRHIILAVAAVKVGCNVILSSVRDSLPLIRSC